MMDDGKNRNEDILARHADELASVEQGKWEDGGFYGDDPKPLEGERLAKWNAAKEKIHPTSIRLPSELLAKLKRGAEENGLGLHSYIRMLLTQALKKSA
jgi:hypothetical protein